MTNVPDDVRAMWTDLYKLFDVHYNSIMENNEQVWDSFWEDADRLLAKYGSNPILLQMVVGISDYYAERIKGVNGFESVRDVGRRTR